MAAFVVLSNGQAAHQVFGLADVEKLQQTNRPSSRYSQQTRSSMKSQADEALTSAYSNSFTKTSLFALVVTAAATGRAALRRWRRSRGGKGNQLQRYVSSAPTMSTAPTRAPNPVDVSQIFDELCQRSKPVARSLAGLPELLPMALLSVYTALPLFAALAAHFCPNTSPAARILAAGLGGLAGSAVGSGLAAAKKEAARVAISRVLADQMKASSASELRRLVDAQRRRFGVAAGSKASEVWEESVLCTVYEELLFKLLDGPEHDAGDLPSVQRLKAALELDGIILGNAHRHVAQLLVSRGYSGLEGEPMRIATDKLLFLSDRIFSEEDSEEAADYEMGRLRQVLKLSDSEVKTRVSAVSRALYQQNLSAVVDKVDNTTREVLANAKAAFGLAGEEAERMNTETYRQIVSAQVSSGSLAPSAREELKRAQGVLQLSDRAAETAFAAVVLPIFRKDVEEISKAMLEASVPDAAARLKTRGEDLGLTFLNIVAGVTEGYIATMRSLYNEACKEFQSSDPSRALIPIDKMLAFGITAEAYLKEVKALLQITAEDEATSLVLDSDSLASRRLFGVYLERYLDGKAPENAPLPEALAMTLELSQADIEASRLEICQPRFRALLEKSIEKAETGGPPLSMAKLALSAEKAKFQLPVEAIEETAVEVYKARLTKLGSVVLKGSEKEDLDAARGFLGVSAKDARVLHIKAFSKVYENAVMESMDRSGIISPEAQEALTQLRERLCLEEGDAQTIFYSVIETKLKELMGPVRDAYEEAVYTKEALLQLNKERGKDIGDDPTADGTGGELGIKERPQLENVRGFKLMEELSKVADFYTRNQVLKPSSASKDEDEYPVTIGKWIEDKNKEEMYGIFTWNAVTCQDTTLREKWTRAKPHVGGVLGLDKKKQQKLLERMVSRWCNMFIKNKMQETGELGKDDISTLTDWAPMFFGIDKDVTKDMVQAANKGIIQNKVLKLLNKPMVTSEDVQKLRDDVEAWDLQLKKDLDLSRPQLRGLFRVEIAAILEDASLSDSDKVDGVESSRESFGLAEKEAADEMKDLIQSRCAANLINALGDLMQGNETQSVREMQRFEQLAAFATSAGIELKQDWEIAAGQRQRLLQTYISGATEKAPNVKFLEGVLGLVSEKV